MVIRTKRSNMSLENRFPLRRVRLNYRTMRFDVKITERETRRLRTSNIIAMEMRMSASALPSDHN